MLRAELADEREAILRLVARIRSWVSGVEEVPSEETVYAVALLLHHVYTALERLMERVARQLDGDIPAGPDCTANCYGACAWTCRECAPHYSPRRCFLLWMSSAGFATWCGTFTGPTWSGAAWHPSSHSYPICMPRSRNPSMPLIASCRPWRCTAIRARFPRYLARPAGRRSRPAGATPRGYPRGAPLLPCLCAALSEGSGAETGTFVRKFTQK